MTAGNPCCLQRLRIIWQIDDTIVTEQVLVGGYDFKKVWSAFFQEKEKGYGPIWFLSSSGANRANKHRSGMDLGRRGQYDTLGRDRLRLF